MIAELFSGELVCPLLKERNGSPSRLLHVLVPPDLHPGKQEELDDGQGARRCKVIELSGIIPGNLGCWAACADVAQKVLEQDSSCCQHGPPVIRDGIVRAPSQSADCSLLYSECALMHELSGSLGCWAAGPPAPIWPRKSLERRPAAASKAHQ